ncbi:DinB family protein [Paenibacillus septentrionalis]|uniref:DinB family protein n=1 Tax=Paenibacillus septentrionalis TaxID=429342 RepID=A0ABW1V5X9_9BACL
MKEKLLAWYDYNCWANERVLDHLQTVPADIFVKDVNLGFQSISHVLGHIATADRIWYSRISKGISPSSLEFTPYRNVEEARIDFLNNKQSMRAFIESASIEQTVSYKNTSGQPFEHTIEQIVQHVVNHGTYHRGNITTMLRFLGYAGVKTDYIAFLR